jgi:hypothetical protein
MSFFASEVSFLWTGNDWTLILDPLKQIESLIDELRLFIFRVIIG